MAVAALVAMLGQRTSKALAWNVCEISQQRSLAQSSCCLAQRERPFCKPSLSPPFTGQLPSLQQADSHKEKITATAATIDSTSETKSLPAKAVGRLARSRFLRKIVQKSEALEIAGDLGLA